MASPIFATAHQGPVRLHGSQLLELWSPQASQNQKNGKNTDAGSVTIYDKSVLGRILVSTWGASGSKKALDSKKHRNYPEKCEMVNPP